MRRWNISHIFFLGVAGQRRDVELKPNVVNIITGGPGTGKSSLIKAIDYCLGSGKCELPAHVRRRSIAVGVKWTDGDVEIVVGRIIPPIGQDTSMRMFVTSGRNLQLPTRLDEFEGATNLAAGKAFLEAAFGIGDVPIEPPTPYYSVARATLRHVTPYLFVTKEVINSESVLLHGLEIPDKARDIVEAMPYFLRVSDESGVAEERRLRHLRRVLEATEAWERARTTGESARRQQAFSLLLEAHRIGLAAAPQVEQSESDLVALLRALPSNSLAANAYPDDSDLGALHNERRRILQALGATRQRAQATRTAIQDVSGFEGAVTRQREKLLLAEHLKLDEIAQRCPICDAPSDRGRDTARALSATLTKVREESAAVERVKPRLVEYDSALGQEIRTLGADLRRIDENIQSWLRQSEEFQRLADIGQLRSHLFGRISFFLDAFPDGQPQKGPDLEVLRAEIAALETRVDRTAKETKLRRAEQKISQFASEAFSELPTVAPCVGSELDFSARRPDLTVVEAESGAILRMSDVGSDQNYLAMHIALSFALQRYFELVRAPVPGLLVLDQISRPYFPMSGEEDEAEIEGREEDEDVQAMRKHIHFLFEETGRRQGLQVLLIEHAYFADDARYRAATRERWTRASRKALIPLDWPTRDDLQA